MKFISNSVEETISIAEKFACNLSAGDTILYTGEMGAGKTHFTKGIAKYFGISKYTLYSYIDSKQEGK